MITLTLTTSSNTAGAVALIQLQGMGITTLLTQLTGKSDWPLGHTFLTDFSGIDEGLAVCLKEDWAQLMPHGGLRVVELLCEKLQQLGAQLAEANARDIYPEASGDFEADMLQAMALAPSPAAIELLLAQKNNWSSPDLPNLPAPPEFSELDIERLLADTKIFDQLCNMPSIVVVGAANVGKSTLTNRMLGYAASIVADLPGTTRDWVGGMAQLNHVAVRWMDTPGIRSSDDDIEQQAITLAQKVIKQADVLIHLTDMQHGFEAVNLFGRQPDVCVLNKADQLDAQSRNELPEGIIPITATTGLGIEKLIIAILECLGLHEIDTTKRWAFSDRLKKFVMSNDIAGLHHYKS